MTEQPEALRLADTLLAYELSEDYVDATKEAAAELRRLHTENARLFNAIEDSLKNYARVLIERHELHDVNQELLEALKEIASETYDEWTNGAKAQRIAQAAIAKATGEQA